MIKILCEKNLYHAPPPVGGEHILQQGRGTDAVKGLYKTLEDLVWLTQLGLNLLLPLVLCLGGCWWAVNHWGWPMWVYIPAILLGLAAGAQNFWVFAKEHLKRAQKDKPRRCLLYTSPSPRDTR